MKWDRIFWGVVFLAGGLILLGVNLGWLPHDVRKYIWSLWPLILVLIGLRLLWGSWRGKPEKAGPMAPVGRQIEQAGHQMEAAFEEEVGELLHRRGSRLISGLVLVFMGVAMAGASAGWWSWAITGAAAVIGVGLGLILHEFIR